MRRLLLGCLTLAWGCSNGEPASAHTDGASHEGLKLQAGVAPKLLEAKLRKPPRCDLSCGHGTCVRSGGQMSCACEPGWVGAECSACDEGLQDHDGDGACTADCSGVPCELGTCDDANGTAECTCPAGYGPAPTGCAWTGVIQDGEFQLGLWTASGGAEVRTADPGYEQAGVGRVAGAALCGSGALSQQLTMPPLSTTQPLVLRVASRTAAVGTEGESQGWSRMAVRYNDITTPLPRGYCWNDAELCLGEAAYGGTVDLSLVPWELPISCGTTSSEVASFDAVSIEPAAPGSCPLPGEILDGHFLAGSWTASSSSGASAAIVDDGAGGRIAHLEKSSSCEAAALQGLASIPLSGGVALELVSTGTAGTTLEIALDEKLVGAVPGSGGRSNARVCVPSWHAGGVTSLELQLPGCEGATVASFDIESVALVQDAGCGGGPIVDPGFEASGSWVLRASPGNTAAVGPATHVHGGAGALLLEVPQRCGKAAARTSVLVPALQPGAGGPALRFRLWREGTGRSFFQPYYPDPATGGWVERTACIDARHAGKPYEAWFELAASGSTCASITPERAWVDDVEVVLDPGCSEVPIAGYEGQVGTNPRGSGTIVCDVPDLPPGGL